MQGDGERGHPLMLCYTRPLCSCPIERKRFTHLCFVELCIYITCVLLYSEVNVTCVLFFSAVYKTCVLIYSAVNMTSVLFLSS